MTITQAQGYLELGMFSEAIAAIRQLPSDLQTAPAALRIRARSSAALGDWNTANEVADILRHGNEVDREHAACCYQSIAADHFKFGRLEEATNLLRRSISTRPQQRPLILDDPRFTDRFLEQFEKPLQQA